MPTAIFSPRADGASMFRRCTHPAPYDISDVGDADVDSAWREYVAKTMRRSAPVTVCIGVVCDAEYSDGPCVILAADNKSTYGDPPVTTNRVCGKIHDLQPACDLAVAISGDVSMCDVVVSELYEQIKEAKAHEEAVNHRGLQIDNMRIAIREARAHEYDYFTREQMQGFLNTSLPEWQAETNAEKRRKGMAVMRYARQYFPVWLIIGGFLGDNWVLMRSAGAGTISGGDTHYAVGIGNVAALKCLHKRKHDMYSPAPMALVHVAEAMEAARKAAPRYIGKPGDYNVFRRNEPIMRFHSDSPVLAAWLKQGTKSMRDTPELRRQFESQMYEHISLNKA
jgi:20S proteasome alpha/beta subunit